MARYTLFWHQVHHRGGTEYQLIMPMSDLYGPIIGKAFPQLKISNWRPYTVKAQACTIHAGPKEEIEKLERFLTLLHQAVWIQNPALDCCMALDFNFAFDETGEQQYTEAGALEYAAKYKGDADAAKKLLDMMAVFVDCNPLYQGMDGVIAVPPSEPKPFHLATQLGTSFARRLGVRDFSEILIKTKKTAEMKTLSLEGKQEALKGVFRVADANVVKGRRVLLLDDLYQSGTTMRETANALRHAQPKQIVGLAVVKSLRDTDNLVVERAPKDGS